jgi:hypothetical protein
MDCVRDVGSDELEGVQALFLCLNEPTVWHTDVFQDFDDLTHDLISRVTWKPYRLRNNKTFSNPPVNTDCAIHIPDD